MGLAVRQPASRESEGNVGGGREARAAYEPEAGTLAARQLAMSAYRRWPRESQEYARPSAPEQVP